MEKPQKKISRASAARMISAIKGSGLGLSIVRSIAPLRKLRRRIVSGKRQYLLDRDAAF